MKKRKISCQEVEFLRKHFILKTLSEPVTAFKETASNANAEDSGRITEEKELLTLDMWHPSIPYETSSEIYA